MRKLKNKFKEKIYIDDLKRVLAYGFLNMLLFSVLAGALQFFAYSYLHLGFGILVYLFAFMIGKKISESFFNYHPLYPLLAVLFFIIGYFIYNITLYVFMCHNFVQGVRYIFEYAGIMNTILAFLNPLTYTSALGIFNNIMDILIILFGLATAYELPKRKDR